jgi:hypothetical protein
MEPTIMSADNPKDGSTQMNVQQTVNATIVSNGSLLIALQTAMRFAILERTKMPFGDVHTLVERISTEVAKAPASGFDPNDVKAGKEQTMKFVQVIANAINGEIASKS